MTDNKIDEQDDTGHFALEEEVDRIGSLMLEFVDRTINQK